MVIAERSEVVGTQGLSVGEMFGTAVKQLREERGIKGSDFARAVGFSRQDLWQLESRNKTLPPIEVFERIAKALQVSKELLLMKSGYLDDVGDSDIDERIVFASRIVPKGQTDAFVKSVTAIAEALATE